jgi:hypothetical protein
MIANLTDPAVLQPDDGIFSISDRPGETEQFESSVQEAGGDTVRLAAARPLYDIEAHLAALVDTEEMVPEELAAAYAQELQTTLRDHRHARSRGQFILHLKQVAFSHAEASRLEQRGRFLRRRSQEWRPMSPARSTALAGRQGQAQELDGNVITLSPTVATSASKSPTRRPPTRAKRDGDPAGEHLGVGDSDRICAIKCSGRKSARSKSLPALRIRPEGGELWSLELSWPVEPMW